MGLTRIHLRIEGRVQGVWFRESTRRMASSLGLTGWVRNRADGSVEAVFEGEELVVAQAVEWARSGPERALVTRCEADAESVTGETGFSIRPDADD
jgi:acylphosphatase